MIFLVFAALCSRFQISSGFLLDAHVAKVSQIYFQSWFLRKMDQIVASLKWRVPPQIISFHWMFSIIHHPVWVSPRLWKSSNIYEILFTSIYHQYPFIIMNHYSTSIDSYWGYLLFQEFPISS